jgi:acetolactate synthase-1/2/3 large subunit
MRPVTKWNTVLDRAQDIPRVFRAAFNQMTTGRPGAAHVALPFDVQNGSVERADVWGDTSLGRYPAQRVAPDRYFVERAALLRLSAPCHICSGRAVIAGAEEKLLKLAERSRRVATTIGGRDRCDCIRWQWGRGLPAARGDPQSSIRRIWSSPSVAAPAP